MAYHLLHRQWAAFDRDVRPFGLPQLCGLFTSRVRSQFVQIDRHRRRPSARTLSLIRRELLKVDAASGRDEAVDAAIDYGRLHAGTTILLAGDFNDGSHLDWTSSTKDQFDHNGTVVKWRNSVRLTDAGFSDDFRLIHPDPKTHPGVTWPSTVAANPSHPNGRNTSWTPLADERDRIDYIYRTGESLRPVSASLVGPNTYWVRKQIVEAVDATVFSTIAIAMDVRSQRSHGGLFVDQSRG